MRVVFTYQDLTFSLNFLKASTVEVATKSTPILLRLTLIE